MKKRILSMVVGAAVLGASGAAVSGPAFINTGIDGEGPINGAIPGLVVEDGNATTDPWLVVNSNPNATSVYTTADAILTPGETLSFIDAGTTGVTSFNDTDGVTSSNPGSANASSLEGFGTSWGLDLDYMVSGDAVFLGAAAIDTTALANGATFAPAEGLAPTFASGTIEFIYRQNSALSPFDTILADGQKVLELTLLPGQQLTPGNLLLNGFVNYDWFDSPAGGPTSPGGAAGDAIKNFFNFVDPINGNTTFYDIWLEGALAAPPVATIGWGLNTNVEPNLIPLLGGNSGLLTNPGCDQPGGGQVSLCRTTNLNLDIGFTPEVPVPGTLALFGAGAWLMGFFASRRRIKV